MKIHTKAIATLVCLSTLHSFVKGNTFQRTSSTCSGPDPLEFSDSIGMQVEKVGSVPTQQIGAFTYNMMVADNFDDKVFFIDQLMGKIYKYENGKNPVKIFDMETSEIPSGLTLNFDYPAASQTNRVHMMSKGRANDEVYIVFSSTSLPEGWNEADGKLPTEDEFPGYFCGNETLPVSDLYRVGTIPDCVSMGAGINATTIYNTFYKYTLSGDTLSDPKAFFVQANQLLPGHLGGGMTTVDNGKVLWSVGDCLMYGTDGRAAPQLDNETCGKILLIDPDSGSYEVVAKGVRNSQQMRIVETTPYPLSLVKSNKLLVFMDIGGVTAEEVNAKKLSDILDGTTTANFGWGRDENGIAREGTFSVEPGALGILGTEPPCDGDMEIGEEGFDQPWIQFGRTETDIFHGISSFSVGCFDKLKLIWSEFNTGLIMGTTEEFCVDDYQGPSKGYKIKLYDTDGNYLEGGLNDLVMEELGEVGYYRGDPRLFHYPDGTAGVFIERTGIFYKLTEIEI